MQNPHLNICTSHWNSVKKHVIDYCGLDFIVRTDNEVNAIVERAMDGSYDSDDDFDPLLLANFYIWKVALNTYGVQHLMSPTDSGKKRCPLCEHSLHSGNPDKWIETASIEALMEARKQGFTATIQ